MKTFEQIINENIKYLEALPLPNMEKIIQSAEQYADQFRQQWVSVEDAPLIEQEPDGRFWTTEAGSSQFIAAVPYTDSNKHGEELWWMHHCVFDNGQLCIVCEDSNEPAGWNIEDVTHYQIITPPTK